MFNKSYVLENVIILILLKTNENKETVDIFPKVILMGNNQIETEHLISVYSYTYTCMWTCMCMYACVCVCTYNCLLTCKSATRNDHMLGFMVAIKRKKGFG